MFKRLINHSESNSFFLFGPRGTGKSTFLSQTFSIQDCLWIDLLNKDLDSRLSSRPQLLLEMVEESKKQKVVIDEVQKIPELLDVVHHLIEKNKILFALTGSSARKLKKGGANLLAGRAFVFRAHPLTHREMEEQFNLNSVLMWGALPKIISLSEIEKKLFLQAYVQTYYQEEIVAEQLVRRLKPFRFFLDIASQMNGTILNYSKIARDIQVDVTTVQSYFEILEDTLVGFLLPPFHLSLRKRQRTNSKFYYFDLGLQRALLKRLDVPLIVGTYDYGKVFEHFLILEIKRLIEYQNKDWQLSYLRTKDGAEIDLILERPGLPLALIEIKSTQSISTLSDEKLLGFQKLCRDLKIPHESFVLSQDPIAHRKEGIHFLPWQKGLQDLGL